MVRFFPFSLPSTQTLFSAAAGPIAVYIDWFATSWSGGVCSRGLITSLFFEETLDKERTRKTTKRRTRIKRD